MENLKKKYGLITGIAMVVGIVIGSGVFIKASNVLLNTDGKLSLSLIAWFIGGAIMVVGAYCFSLMATRVEKMNGAVDYVEISTNPKFGYATGWYFATVYYPIITSILGFVSMDYFYKLCGWTSLGTWHFWVAVTLLIIFSFVLNTVSPKIAGYYQVSTTTIKLIPIFIIAVIGTIVGIVNGNTKEAFTSVGTLPNVKNDFGAAILSTIFAYEGWVVATSINAELKNSKKNLPLALVLGTLIVIGTYILYYIGLSSLIPDTNDIMEQGSHAPVNAMEIFVGGVGEKLFTFLIICSCLGTLNGLTMGASRGMYSLACRGQGPKPEVFSKLHQKYNISVSSSMLGLVLTLFFMGLWVVSFETNFKYLIIMDELSIAFLYTSYIFVYIWIMKNGKDLKVFSRYIMPILAILGSVFLTFAATGLFSLLVLNDSSRVVNFGVFGGIAGIFIIIGLFFYHKNAKPIGEFE